MVGALGTRKESSLARAHGWPVQSLAFAGADLMASGDTQRTVNVWYEGKLLHSLNLSSRQDKVRPTERVRGLAFSPTGDTLYVACGDLLRAISMTTSEVRWEYRPPRSFGFLIVSPISLAVSPTGEVAISTDGGRTLCFTSEGAMLAQWWDNDSPRHLALLNGDQIVGTDSFSLCRWKRTGRKMAKRRLDERAYGFAASANGEQVCLRSIHAVQVWDVVADFLLATYPVSYGGPVVTMSPDGRKVAFCGTSEITLCTVGGKAEILQAEGASVRSLRFATHGLDLVAGCSDGSIRHWHLD